MIKLFSVPHTGTRFMVELLEAAGLVRNTGPDVAADFMQVHFDGRKKHSTIYQQGGTVIIPIRDRKETEASWVRRRKQLSDFELMWADMEYFATWYEDPIYFVHIDDPSKRDADISALSNRLGLTLNPDWDNKVGHGM